jgi:hypothetical protein
MLICAVSLILYGIMDVVVHNQYSDIELISPVYFCNRGTYDEYPIEKKDVSTMMRIGFSFGLDKLPGGILMYEVQGSGNTKSDCQPSTDTTSTEAVEVTSKMMRLLVVWKIEHFGEPSVYIVLVEHDKELVLNGEDKLAQLYDKVNDQFSRCYSFSESTWLVCDNTVLKATYEIVQKESFELNIAISKGTKDKYTKSALWIDSERQVSSLVVIYSMLIYLVSFILQSTVNVTIDNQCANIELTSQVYFTKDTTCHEHLPQKMDSKNIMRATFKTSAERDTFGGILLYHLQRNGNSESDQRSNADKDASISTQLLVMWEFRIDNLYSHVWLIEHESVLTWGEDKLERIYDVYDSLYDTDIIFNTGRWLLEDDTKLQAVCETSDEGRFEINITISEEKDLTRPRKPLWIDSNR